MLKKILFCVSLILLVSNVFSQSMDEQIKTEASGFKGNVWIYAKNLDSGADYSLRGGERVRTASTIKLPIMTEVFHQVEQGKLNWTDEFTITKESKVGGSGVLVEFSDGLKIDLKTAVNIMIVSSDNIATNMVLSKVSSDDVNGFMKSMGMKNTFSLRKVGGGSDAKVISEEQLYKLFGIGVTTPKEMVKLLEKLEKGEVVSPAASAEMINILKRQQHNSGIGRGVLDTVPVASKSGALDRMRGDVGIIYTRRGRIAMAVYTDDNPVIHYSWENEAEKLIWRISVILQNGLALKLE
jgi:beta-lactamase class A